MRTLLWYSYAELWTISTCGVIYSVEKFLSKQPDFVNTFKFHEYLCPLHASLCLTVNKQL